jgi:hypothetical protein
MVLATDPGFQGFMQKASRIVVIFMKDQRTPHELARSVLQFLKIAMSLIHEDQLKEVVKFVIDNMFN